jgi:small subunit ribosomal protein S5
MLKRVLHVRKVSRQNSGGKQRTVSACVVVGDENGSAGLGMGRGVDTPQAISKAIKHAERNLILFPRLENRTLFSDVFLKFHCVRLELRSSKPGFGVD